MSSRVGPRQAPRIFAAVLLAAALTVLSACGGAAAGTGTVSSAVTPNAPAKLPPPASTAAGAAVLIQDFAFTDPTVSIPVGATVTWTNHDPDEHTVTAIDGTFDSSTLKSGAAFSHTFDVAGTFDYA